MIKNIILDMGGVLMRFDTKALIERLGLSEEDSRILHREVFMSLEWARQDRGSLTEEEACASICARTPEHLHTAVKDLIYRWERPILPIEGMEALLKSLKQNGYRIYLLSNANSRQHVYWPDVPGSQYFDGTLISADVKLVKPQPEIYHLACTTFHLVPEECAYIDDLPLNAEGAYYIGMHAFVFHDDMDELRTWLVSLGVRI